MQLFFDETLPKKPTNYHLLQQAYYLPPKYDHTMVPVLIFFLSKPKPQPSLM